MNMCLPLRSVFQTPVRFFSCRQTAPSEFRPGLAAGIILLAGALASSAANVTMNANDTVTGLTTSYNSAGHWDNLAAPSAGNAYFTANFVLRTPAPTSSGSNFVFEGDSLSVDTGSRFLGKIGANVAGNTTVGTITVNNLILNGGVFEQADVNNDNSTLIVAGNVNVNAASIIGAIGGAGNGSTYFDTLEFTAPISGSAALQVSGPNINAGQDTGVVKLSAPNPYSGTITVSNGNGGVIASTVNRILQLNHLNALGNATLNLNSGQASPVSFVSAVNTGSFNVGALAGRSAQTLTDTAGSPVTLSVGQNNATTTYSGALTDAGSLIKAGSGILTLSGTNTYTGNTVINGGALALAGSGSLSNSATITIASGATFDISSNAFTLGGSQSLLGSGIVNGSVGTISGSKIYGGTDGTYGTNTITTNLTFTAGALVYLDLGTTYNGANDKLVVGGNLALNSTTFHLKAPNGSVNLDTAADYTLVTVGGSISGSPAATPAWDVAPLNAANYSIVQSGNSIKLHYAASAPPTGAGSASGPVTRNQKTTVSVTVTSMSHPISSVTVNATAIGGSASVPLLAAGGNVYTNGIAVAPNIEPGSKTLTATIVDSASLSGSTPDFTMTVITANQTWNGGGANDDWSTNPNWASGAAPGYAGDSVLFAGSTRLTPNMATNYSLVDVAFDGSAGSFVVGTTGNSLTLTGSGVANYSPNSQTLNVPITTAAAVMFNASSGNLTLGQSVTNGGNLLTFSGGNNNVVNGSISGTGGVSKYDSGTLVLNGTNTYAGGTYIDSGTIRIAGAGMLGAGNYAGNITNLGVFQYSSSSTQTLSGVVSYLGVLKDGPGTLILAGQNTFFGDTIISNGVLQIGGTGLLGANNLGNYIGNITDEAVLQYSSSASQILSGTISGSGGLILDGSGTLTLNGANTYSGTTLVRGGTLVYNPVSIGYPTINSLSISNGVVLVNSQNGAAALPVNSLALNNHATLALNYDFGGGNPTAAAVSATSLAVPGTAITIKISGYGATTGQFPLIAYNSAPLPNISNFVLGALPPGVTANLVNNTGSKTIDLNITSVVPSTWIPLVASDTFGNSSFNSGLNWSGGNPPTAGNGYYTKNYILRTPADTNAYTFAGSVLSIDPDGRFLLKGTDGQVITVNNLILNGGVVDQAFLNSDNYTETLAGNITLQSGTTSYMGALGGASAETLLVTAPIGGAGNLQIGGANVNAGQDVGIVVLVGANTYTGNTTVAGGILLVNGSLGSSPTTVNATFGGTGTINSSLTIQTNGTFVPGIPARGAFTAAIGTLTAGNTTINGTMQVKINRGTVPTSDKLVAPSVTVNSGTTLTVNNIGSTNLAAGDTFTLFSTPISGAFGTVNLPALPDSTVMWTNKLAINGTIAVISTSTINTNSPYMTNSVSGGNLTLSWPTDHIGWMLQMQTNSLGKGLGTNWVDVPGSTSTNSVSIPITTTNGVTFYRLKY